MHLSINPSYLCNFSCDFCYLTKEQLRDNTRVPLDVLRQRLVEVTQFMPITQVDLYGGEIGTLPTAYADELIQTIREYCSSINIVTNLSNLPRYRLDNVTISVSYDFECRERHEDVLRNIRMLGRPVHILILATPEVMKLDVDRMINTLSDIQTVVSVEIKPYSQNQANNHNIRYDEYEQFIQKWITSAANKRFLFINDELIRNAALGNANSFSNDHLYITPTGEFAVLDFDLNDREYFRPVSSFIDYVEWASKERDRVFANTYCSKCKYLGGCLSEHLRDVKDITHSCNGYRNLIDWYKNERMEVTPNYLSPYSRPE